MTVLNSRPLALWTVPIMKSVAERQMLHTKTLKLTNFFFLFFSLQTCPAAVALGALFQTRHHVWNVTLVLVDDLDFGHELVVLGQLGVGPQGVERDCALCESPKQRVLDVCRGAGVDVRVCQEKWNTT